MFALRRLALRGFGAFLIGALILVPLFTGGHGHRGEQPGNDSCAACVLKHHSPAVTLAPIVATAPVRDVALVVPVNPRVAIHTDLPCKASRAPPSYTTAGVA